MTQMASVSVYNMEGKETGTMELNDSIFAAPVNEHLVHMAVVLQLANKRQGTQKAKTRSEVRGGGRKPWRQKGTGHARQGSIRAPQWKGGGMVFAPVPRDYSFKMNKKEKVAALKAALSSKVSENKLIVVEGMEMDAPKTKTIQTLLDGLDMKKALVVVDTEGRNVTLSVRNIPTARGVFANSINVYDILKYDNVIMTKSAIAAIEEVYA
jgi:large subunit ribosomal protein L4